MSGRSGGVDLATLTLVMQIRVNLANARTNLQTACRAAGLSDDDSAAATADGQVALLAARLAQASGTR